MKLPSPPTLFLIGLVIFSPTFFNNSSKEIPKKLSELFEKEEKIPVDVVDAQDLIRAVVIARSNSLKSDAEKTSNAKKFIVYRLYRLSGEISKFNQKKSTISPSDKKTFERFSQLSIDWLSTKYVLYFLENGKYPDSVIDDTIKGIPLEDLERQSIQLIEELSKNDGKDYISEFSKDGVKNVRK